ncbi:MAG: hypothetical protein HY741_27955 [Chloroflexi bacterium]|nr:hypothetical protein [Chloroflexota bacterium]
MWLPNWNGRGQAVAPTLTPPINSESALGYSLPALALPYQVYIVKVRARIGQPGITIPPGVLYFDHQYAPTLGALAAHEFFHTVHWTYPQSCMTSIPGTIFQLPEHWFRDENEDLRWWMEATAQWAQHEAVGADQDYAVPVAVYLQKPWQHIYYRPVSGDPERFSYSVLFPFYLIEHSGAGNGGRDIIRATWQQYQTTGNCGPMLPVLDAVLGNQTPLGSVRQTFPAYTEANYFLSYQQQADFRQVSGGAPNADVRPNPELRTLDNNSLAVSGPAPTFGGTQVERLAASYIDLRNGFNPAQSVGRRLDITVDIYRNPLLPAPTTGTVKIWTINTWTPPTATYTTIQPILQDMGLSGLNRHYRATVSIPNFDTTDHVTIVFTNTENSLLSPNFSYSASISPQTPTVTATPP